ncbi:hypothetical protein ACWEWU_14585 [Staphylococcus xylosus]
MKLEEFQKLSQNVKTVITKFRQNPGKFASIVLQMYWDMKAERDTLIDDLKVLREKNEKLERENKDLRLQADTYFDEWQKSKLKAKAFDGIDEVYGDSDLYSDECVLETIQEQIDRLEQK